MQRRAHSHIYSIALPSCTSHPIVNAGPLMYLTHIGNKLPPTNGPIIHSVNEPEV